MSFIIPAGTQVVTLNDIRNRSGEIICRRGSVGIVIKSPSDSTHSYRIRLIDGTEHSFALRDIAILKQYQMESAGHASQRSDGEDLLSYVIYRCIIGSRAYGLDQEGSDIDRRGVYLPPARLHWSIFPVPEQLEDDSTQECYWEIQKFITLALKANPNVLECLYSPIVEEAAPLAREMLSIRGIFLSKLVYQTYNGYVMSQFKKLEGDIRNRGEIRWKHAMHLIRLLMSGVVILNEGFVPVSAGEHREKLLAIRRGEITWEEVNEWRLELHRSFDEAFRRTSLPDRPDYERANEFLIKARLEMVTR